VFLAAGFFCILSLIITSLPCSLVYGIGLQGVYLLVSTLLLSSLSQEGLRFFGVECCRKAIHGIALTVRGGNHRSEDIAADISEHSGSMNHSEKAVHGRSVATCEKRSRLSGDELLVDSFLAALVSGNDGVDITAGLGWAITKGLILFIGPVFAAVSSSESSLAAWEVLYRFLISAGFGILDVSLTTLAFRGAADTFASRLSLACAFHAGAVSLIVVLKPLSGYVDGDSSSTGVARWIGVVMLFLLSLAAGLVAARMKHIASRPLPPSQESIH
jgi:hypothetical protein